MEKIEKEARALILDKHLTEIGLPVYGRSTRIRNDMKATAATVAGWLAGSLPSDFPTGLKFCDTYGLCPWLWTTGISYTGVKDSYDIKSVAIYIRKFEREHNVFLTSEQFDEVYDALIQNWAEGKIFAQRLIPFLKG
tara:strand:- start:57 stop:467 length:411 start_codon:yes stop_codon:yes gene_type:complete